MKNTNDSADDGDQLIAPVRDYRTLLETTRPLLIIKVTLLSSRLPIYRDQPIFLETGDCCRESILRRGEIVSPHLSGQTVTGDEGLAAVIDLPLTSFGLKIRIYIGMS
jgi:hypothetical protein